MDQFLSLGHVRGVVCCSHGFMRQFVKGLEISSKLIDFSIFSSYVTQSVREATNPLESVRSNALEKKKAEQILFKAFIRSLVSDQRPRDLTTLTESGIRVFGPFFVHSIDVSHILG